MKLGCRFSRTGQTKRKAYYTSMNEVAKNGSSRGPSCSSRRGIFKSDFPRGDSIITANIPGDAVCGNDSKRKSKSEKSQSVTDVAGAVVELPQAAVLLYDQACALVETKVRVRCAYAAELLTHSFTSRDLRFTPSHVYHLRVPCTQFASMRRSAIT